VAWIEMEGAAEALALVPEENGTPGR
jgi:hypothetical protein